jgi:hypothetical protein
MGLQDRLIRSTKSRFRSIGLSLVVTPAFRAVETKAFSEPPHAAFDFHYIQRARQVGYLYLIR